eukprot:8139_1
MSNEFSKTYRKMNENELIESVIGRHSRFYHWGLLLYQCVNLYGDYVVAQKITSFYHGIGEELLFPSIGCVKIYTPLSTSTEFIVAVNFANCNSGIIVEFGNCLSSDYGRYFCLDWVSDYSNESECLLIQNNYNIELKNITHARYGCELKIILQVIGIIDKFFTMSPHYDSVSDQLCQLVVVIIHNQLSYFLSDYKRFKSLHVYAKKLINTLLTKKSIIYCHWDRIKNSKHKVWYNFLWHSKSDGLNVKLINALFPNLERIIVLGTSYESFNDCVSFIKQNKSKIKIVLQCDRIWNLDNYLEITQKRNVSSLCVHKTFTKRIPTMKVTGATLCAIQQYIAYHGINTAQSVLRKFYPIHKIILDWNHIVFCGLFLDNSLEWLSVFTNTQNFIFENVTLSHETLEAIVHYLLHFLSHDLISVILEVKEKSDLSIDQTIRKYNKELLNEEFVIYEKNNCLCFVNKYVDAKELFKVH